MPAAAERLDQGHGYRLAVGLQGVMRSARPTRCLRWQRDGIPLSTPPMRPLILIAVADPLMSDSHGR
jgi:hypothetical protein